MSNVTVQEALKAAIEAFELHAKQYPHMVKGYCIDALEDCKAALSEIDKCEPVGYLCESPDKIARIFVDKPLDILNHTNTPLYTSPQPCEWVNKDLLETDDGKWDATLMALWRRLQRHQNGADFWNESEIPEDEMYIFRAHFATALLASPLKQLNTKG